jgi:hypothetical protein
MVWDVPVGRTWEGGLSQHNLIERDGKVPTSSGTVERSYNELGKLVMEEMHIHDGSCA